MKLRSAVLALVIAVQVPQVGAQNTPINLPASLCSVQGSNYLFCSQIDGVSIEGKKYNISLLLAPNGVTGSHITFTNVADGAYWTETLESTRSRETPVAPNNYYEQDTTTFHTVNGPLAGKIDFDVVGHRACGRACAEVYVEVNGTIALE